MKFGAPSTRSSHSFAQSPSANIQRSRFDRSYTHKTTLDAGGLVPFFVDEVLPGDTFNLDSTIFARLSTPIKPVMDNLHLETFYFFVPNRLVWTNWEKFCGAQDNPGDSTSYGLPQITGPVSFAEMTLGDYFGLPINKNLGSTTQGTLQSLPFRAYNLIWNQWFRDENLQNSLTVPTGDGPDSAGTFALQNRGRRHDYFCGSLPWPQKTTAVQIPLAGTVAPVGDGTAPTFRSLTGPGTNYAGRNLYANAATNTTILTGAAIGTADTVTWDNPHLTFDLSTATNATINSLRQAFQIQKLYERDARGGTRYVEILLAHFGVVSPDFRLQRAEYLGGSSQVVNFTPIAQTTPASGGSTPIGNLAAFGTAVSRRNGFTKSFVEHGIVLGLVNIRADKTYQQGLERMWSRLTRFDFYWPALANIGEQAVLNREIYYNNDASDVQAWGYQERFAEYRYKPSICTGLMRSTATGTLDVWHLAEKFTSRPALNSTFIQDSSATVVDRVIATPSEPQFILDVYHRYFCARPMPVYSVPGLVDHF